MAAPTMRAVISAAEPGGKPMIRRMGCEGKSPARPCGTSTTAVSARIKPKTAVRRMAVLPLLRLVMSDEPVAATPADCWLHQISEAILFACGPGGDVAHWHTGAGSLGASNTRRHGHLESNPKIDVAKSMRRGSRNPATVKANIRVQSASRPPLLLGVPGVRRLGVEGELDSALRQRIACGRPCQAQQRRGRQRNHRYSFHGTLCGHAPALDRFASRQTRVFSLGDKRRMPRLEPA